MRTISGFLTSKSIWVWGVLAVLIVMMSLTTFAQEPTGAVTTSQPADPEASAAAAAEAAWLHEMMSRNIFDFNIAYLVKEGTVSADLIESEGSLNRMLGAQPFYSWEAFANQNEQTPFQIILIHESFYDQVDVEFTRHAYRHQVILIGVGMPFEHLVEITGDRCRKNPNPHVQELASEMILFFTYTVFLEDEQYRNHVNERMLGACKDDYDTKNTEVSVLVGTTHLFISDLHYEDATWFAWLLKSKTIDYGLLHHSDFPDED